MFSKETLELSLNKLLWMIPEKFLEKKLLAAPPIHDKIDHSLSGETCGTLSRNSSREHRHSNQREENLSNLENVGIKNKFEH